MHPKWTECLQEDYTWIATTGMTPTEIAKEIIQDIGDDVQDVYESSVWAVCMAYLDYREGTHYLSPQDLLYTRNRGGVLGCKVIDNEVVTITIRQYLYERDGGFYDFTWGIRRPPAA